MEGVRKLRVYADTSVFGGCFDPEFEVESRKFFDVGISNTSSTLRR